MQGAEDQRGKRVGGGGRWGWGGEGDRQQEHRPRSWGPWRQGGLVVPGTVSPTQGPQ